MGAAVEDVRGAIAGVPLRELKRFLRRLPEQQLEELFADARMRLRRECAAKRGVAASFHPVFSEAWISRVAGITTPKRQVPIRRIHKERLVWYYMLPGQVSLYQQLAGFIGQNDSERGTIIETFGGDYRYFRYAKKADEQMKYVSGKIRIFDDDGSPAFGHWSHDYDPKSSQPEHAGFVFRSGAHIFLAGQAPGVMRLSIARIKQARSGIGPMLGLVLSMRNESSNDPFAARFLLVHSGNAKLLAELDPGLPGAEERFLRQVKRSAQDNYMLIG